tara:strand:+ start:102 stop:359 length:258 start_codon:yes stop_codon:yes gene_type:complete
MDAKKARAMTKAVKPATVEETLTRLHRAIESAARLQRTEIRVHCDKMTLKGAAATLEALQDEEYEVAVEPDKKKKGRVWFDISWA